MPEVQVVADDQSLGPDPAQQHLCSEVKGGAPGLYLVELDQKCMIDPTAAYQAKPILKARQERRCTLSTQDHCRVPDKGDHGRLDLTLSSLTHRPGKDLLVTKVDAVEGAQRRHGPQVDQPTVTPTMHLHDHTRYWRNDRQAYAGIVTR